jgi:predicted AlkP superfamily phosphohydrolase/phosphomutase
MASTSPRVLVLGLDSVSPWLLYERFLPRMPRMKELLDRSLRGTLTTIDPPITVPAWAVMFAGVDPGTLGLYGFRHRRPGSYWDNYIPSSRTMRRPLLWDRLSRVGRRVCVIGMPPGYPPPAVNGVYISDFLTPDNAPDYISPLSMKPEVEKASGGYVFDVTFRAEDRERIAVELTEMTKKRFAVARHLFAKEKWDLFALHEIGPDRLHHTFWKYFDRSHPRFEADSKFRNVADDYYTMLDAEIGQLLDLVPDDVRILVASDHGSQAMQGCFCINDWLAERGYLAFKGARPKAGTPIEKTDIDWSRTRAWGAGGYYARIFYNVKGREPQGTVAPAELPSFEAELSRELGTIRKPDGSAMGIDVKVPKAVYREVNGDPPDLMVYFANAAWRSAGTVGYDSLYLTENDTGPDDSVHSFQGVYALSGAGHGPGADQKILDIAPSLMQILGLPVPKEMQGTPIREFV